VADTNDVTASSTAPHLIVGIGASAGGIRALQAFFGRVAPASNSAYVVVLHLSPEHDSKLAQVIQAVTPMPVTQVADAVRVEANHVYVLSPNRSLTMNDGMLAVTDMTRLEHRRAPVDVFLRTLADAHRTHAVAVILSGTGSDGTSGAKRVKEHGGLTIVQDPATAEYPDMPAAAIATGLVDLVLPPDDMPAKIAEYSSRVDAEAALAAPSSTELEPDAVREILTVLRIRTGHDFSNYKPGTVLRRIARRMNVRQLATLREYASYMREQPDEPTALMKDLLISVTNFFRDVEAFAALERRVIPRLFAAKRSTDHVRVWSAGCATGEEAYTLAMLLVEHSLVVIDPPAIQVFATDLDDKAIGYAREAFYSDAEVVDLSEERLQRFFVRAPGGYRVRRELRELVLFASHNVIKDPPFSHLDLISCRNLLIYLNRAVQERVIETFHFALRPGAYLFLGSSEAPDGANELFFPFDRGNHIFESRSVSSRLPLPPVDVPTFPRPAGAGMSMPAGGERILPAELHHRLLEQYAPPSLIVNEDHKVVHISEGAARYLRISAGEPSRDLMQLVWPEIKADLRTALHRAARERQNVDVHGVRAGHGNPAAPLTVSVRPVLQDGDPARGYFLIIFAPEEAAADRDGSRVELTSPLGADTRESDEELARMRSQLRITIEQYETQVEEAKASNEELQALNEELRSSAEELETSKEELQSVNEELTTVNQELKIKIEELGLTNNDIQNFINSTDVAAIFLDRALRVKLATPRARDIFNLLPSDAGRLLSDITSKLLYDDLQKDVAAVLGKLQAIEREVAAADGRSFVMRVLPYRTVDDHIDGVVITFLDISQRVIAERRAVAGEERLRLLIDSAIDYAIFTMDTKGIVDSWNSGAQRMFGYRAEEIVGRPGEILFTAEDRSTGVPESELRRAAELGRADDERWHVRKDGTQLYCSGVTTSLGHGGELGFAKIARDLTVHRQADLALREAHAELENRVHQRTAELQAKVAQHAAAEEHVTMLLRKLVTAQEDERARIARDLHDQLGQQLTTLRLTLERHATACAAPEGAGAELRQALELTAAIDDEVDFLAWELRPAVLDHLGLVAALPRFLSGWSKHYGVTAEFRSIGVAPGHLSRDAEVTFYRIAQEALNNVVKHAHASRVDVMLEIRDRMVTLVIEDDGVGFDVSDSAITDNGLGLIGMRERAAQMGATLDIESTAGQGTTIFLRCQAADRS
jgi:two-component system, chemotaxis family, CheB/CheR fusion protein